MCTCFRYHLVVPLASLASATIATAQLALSADQVRRLDLGQQVVREERIAGSAWPRVTIHQLVDAKPLEAAAVFADYARHSTYLPGLKTARVSRRLSPRVAEVDYVLDVPMFPDEDYTVRDSVSRSVDATTYSIHWGMVRARSTKAIVGSARFHPYRNARTGADATLIIYDNLVIPGQALAGPLKGRALRQVRQTVTALVAEIERERREHADLLAAQIDALVAALDAPPVE